MSDERRLEELAYRIVGAAPRLDEAGRRTAVALYRLLAQGVPVPPTALAQAVGLSERSVRETLEGRAVFYDNQGAVIGFGGLTLAEMLPHQFIVGGRRLYTWCAWDGLFIPSILGETVRVASIDALTREPISLLVAPDKILSVEPSTTVVSFLTPDRPFDSNVIVSFCHFVHFFRSEQVGALWTARHPGTFLLSLEDAFALGQRITGAFGPLAAAGIGGGS